MRIGDLVTYQGKPYYLRGLDPMSVPDRRAHLADVNTGATVSVPLADVRPSTLGEGREPPADLVDGGASPENP